VGFLVRTKWRVDHIDYSITKLSEESFNMNFYRYRLRSRRSVITSLLFDFIISVYNGKVLKQVSVLREMEGFKLGEFIFTKSTGSKIHSNNKTKRKKKKVLNSKRVVVKKSGLKKGKKKSNK